MERWPIGLVVAFVALLVAAGASFLWDSTPPSPPGSVAGGVPSAAQAAAETDEGESAQAETRPEQALPEAAGPAELNADPGEEPLNEPEPTVADEAARSDVEAEGVPAAKSDGDEEEEEEAPVGGDREEQPGERAGPASPQPLANLSPTAARLIDGLPNEIGVAVIDLRRDLTFAADANAYHDLASLAKVPLMLTFLDVVAEKQRPPNELEQTLLELMIQWSDNKAATAIEERVGEGRERAFVEEIGLWPRIRFLDEGWGAIEGSALGVALLFRELVAGDLISPAVREGAMDLLAGVAQGQRWGVAAGLGEESGATAGLKNGWYPAGEGWVVHSAGYFLDASGEPDYVLAILSGNHPTLDQGIETVERIAAQLHAALRLEADRVVRANR